MPKDHLLAHGGTRTTPQSQPIPGRADQIENEAGGYVFAIDKWQRLRRFLILGSEAGSFYASERTLTIQNVTVVHECIAEDGLRTVREIGLISMEGRAPQNDTALYALATCISAKDKQTVSAAAEALPLIARIGTHLYHFVAYAETQRGWGRALRWAVSNWYADKQIARLPGVENIVEEITHDRIASAAFQAVKYRQRDGWSHRDLLRLAHPTPENDKADALYHWITQGELPDVPTVEKAMNVEPIVLDGITYLPDTADLPFEGDEPIRGPFRIIEGFEKAQHAKTPAETAALVREYLLPREAVLTDHLKDPDVWRAMLDTKMPLGAMTRNLANMTRYGILNDGHQLLAVCSALTDAENVRKSKLHPLSLLLALTTYKSGRGFRGGNAWTPIPAVIDALDEAFYLAFDNVETTGLNILLGVDVSGSMNHGGVAGADQLTAREAAVAMALVTLHAEPGCRALGFTSRLYPLPYSKRQRLDDALAGTPRTSEGTDCSLPILGAIRDLEQGTAGNMLWDAIILYTDNQTWYGNEHVAQAIARYRQLSGKQTRLVACGMVANEFTVCDPTDLLSLNVVGFDTSAPALIGEFAAGKI